MLEKIKSKIKKNTEIFALSLLIIITVISTSFYNQSKKKILNNYKNTINNVYLKKTLNHFFNNLEPKFKEINHKVTSGETFQSILKQYQVKDKEIDQIKNIIKKKINLNNLNTNNKISFVFDQSSNLIKEFTFQISNKEKIYLKRDVENKFSEKILLTKLKKEILYKENIILQSLYRSASQEKIPANIIIDFASIYGFQVDFQRDIRKKDAFQIMYEAFRDDNGKLIETGNILFANLKLSGRNNRLYFFSR